MDRYIELIQKYSVGLEGSSCWIWYEKEKGSKKWESKGYAYESIGQSLEALEQFIYEEGLNDTTRESV